MFAGLRQGGIVYILSKEDKPKLEIGTVTNIPSLGTYSLYPQQTVDIQVKVGATPLEFKQLPGASSIVNYNNGKTVVSDNKELLCSEVETMRKASLDVIEHIDYHKGVLESCDEIMKQLNPLIALQKELENKINNLETKVSGMENKLDSIAEMLNKALNK